jgi:hypothetical protein
MSSPHNKNGDVLTPTTAINNNLAGDNNKNVDLGDNNKNNVDVDREKRDRSTEKQSLVVVDNGDVLIVESDSLENLKAAEAGHEAADEAAAEDDEGLGDINHGSEASRFVTTPSPETDVTLFKYFRQKIGGKWRF